MRKGSNGWVIEDGLVESINNKASQLKSSFYIYLRTLYWSATTIVSSGYGDVSPVTTPEYILTIFFFIGGYFVIASFIAAITNMMLVSGAEETQHEKLLVSFIYQD